MLVVVLYFIGLFIVYPIIVINIRKHFIKEFTLTDQDTFGSWLFYIIWSLIASLFWPIFIALSPLYLIAYICYRYVNGAR